MGKSVMMGSDAQQIGEADLLSPEQRAFFNKLLSPGSAMQAQGSLGGLLQPYNEEFFQKSVVDPSMQMYKEQILPAIGQQFVDANASSSSALNQALSSSAQNLANALAGQRIGLQGQMANQNLGGLGFLGQLLGQRTKQPIIQDARQGILGDVLGALGKTAGAFFGV